MDEVDDIYIDNALISLMSSLGTKEYIDRNKIVSHINAKRVKEAVTEIAEYLGLPVKINLTFLPKGYNPTNNDGFHSTDLVKTDWRGRGTASITAQVNIPSNLPLYGANKMVDFPINIRVSENYSEYPLTFITVLAHELSHIVLHSIWHKEKDNEFYTDLTAMLLGFAEIMMDGRVIQESDTKVNGSVMTTTTHTTKYGYLSDENFNFAFERINKALRSAREKKDEYFNNINIMQERLSELDKEILYFRKYLDYVDKHLKKRITPEDGHWISSFHQADYTEEFESAINTFKNELNKFSHYLKTLYHYNDHVFEEIKKREEKLNQIRDDLYLKYERIHDSVRILKRYIPFWYKIQYSLKITPKLDI